MTRSLASGLLLAVTIAACLTLAEGATRWIAPAAATLVHYPCVYQPDARFGFRYRPSAVERLPAGYAIKINREGFHDREWLPSGRAGLRVLAVGDSFTAGLHVPRARTWPQALENALRERGFATADVVNVGLDGTGSGVHLDLLRSYLPRVRPQVAILAFFANDFPDTLNGRFTRECYEGTVLSYQSAVQRDALRARVDSHRRRGAALWLFERFHLVRLVVHAALGPRNLFRMRFQQPSAAELGIDDALRRERRPRIARVFAEIEALARDCECRLLVAPVPPRGELGGSELALREALGTPAFEVLDVVPALRVALRADGRPPEALHFAHDAHLNAYGNRLYAEAIANAIDWNAVLTTPPSTPSKGLAGAASAAPRGQEAVGVAAE